MWTKPNDIEHPKFPSFPSSPCENYSELLIIIKSFHSEGEDWINWVKEKGRKFNSESHSWNSLLLYASCTEDDDFIYNHCYEIFNFTSFPASFMIHGSRRSHTTPRNSHRELFQLFSFQFNSQIAQLTIWDWHFFCFSRWNFALSCSVPLQFTLLISFIKSPRSSPVATRK